MTYTYYTYCRDADNIILCPALLCCNKMWLVFVVNYRRPLKLSKQPLSAGRQGSLYTIVNLRIEREREREISSMFFLQKLCLLRQMYSRRCMSGGKKAPLVSGKYSTVYISLQGLVAGAKKLCGDIVRVKAQRNRFPFPDSAVSLSELKLSVITLLFLTLQCHCRSQAQRNRTPFPDSDVTMTLLIKKISYHYPFKYI